VITSYESIFRTGYTAFMMLIDATANPYHDHDKKAWQDGWTAAKADWMASERRQQQPDAPPARAAISTITKRSFWYARYLQTVVLTEGELRAAARAHGNS